MHPYESWTRRTDEPSRSTEPSTSIYGALPVSISFDPSDYTPTTEYQASNREPGSSYTYPASTTYTFRSQDGSFSSSTVSLREKTLFHLTTDPTMPTYTVLRTADDRPLGLLEFRRTPTVEIRGIAPKQPVSQFLRRSSDGR